MSLFLFFKEGVQCLLMLIVDLESKPATFLEEGKKEEEDDGQYNYNDLIHTLANRT
jgi:hypothetical protein